jgi:uncharacterized membrane protein YgcG
MPLTSISLVSQLNWRLQNPNNSYYNLAQEGDGTNFTIGAISLADWTQIYAQVFTVLPGSTTTIDVSTFLSLVYELVTLKNVLSLYVLPIGGDIRIGPGATNPLVIPVWSGTGAYSFIEAGGNLVYSPPHTSLGTSVDTTHRNIKITNMEALASAWIPFTTYAIDDKVSRLGINYRAQLGSTNVQPPSPVFWQVVDTAVVEIYLIGNETPQSSSSSSGSSGSSGSSSSGSSGSSSSSSSTPGETCPCVDTIPDNLTLTLTNAGAAFCINGLTCALTNTGSHVYTGSLVTGSGCTSQTSWDVTFFCTFIGEDNGWIMYIGEDLVGFLSAPPCTPFHGAFTSVAWSAFPGSAINYDITP